MRRCHSLLLLLAATALAGAPAAEPARLTIGQQEVTLAEHPRLMLPRTLEAALTGPLAESLLRQAEEAAATDSPARVMQGRRLLEVSRTYLRRITAQALSARLTGREDLRRGAVRDLLAACAFSDWNPSHYLDTAEMTAAVALGYDWLYEHLTEEERERVITAIATLGLRTSLPDRPRWSRNDNNWNPVCHGGLGLGALAIADREPDLARAILERALEDLPYGLAAYLPDGAHLEGPTYWDYGTTYLVMLIDGLRTAVGTDFGLARSPGLMESAAYITLVRGPSGAVFNYGDGMELAQDDFHVRGWFAREAGQAWLAPDPRRLGAKGRAMALAYLWGREQPTDATPLPTTWSAGGRNPVALFRSGPGATASFLGIKGGSPSNNHGHQDTGAFVYESRGQRWFIDLGKEDYTAIERAGRQIWKTHQESDRWKVFRHSTAAHSVPRIEGHEPLVAARATLEVQGGDGPDPAVRVDLTPLYGAEVASLVRVVSFPGRDGLVVQDTYRQPQRPLVAHLQLITRAKAEVDGAVLTLRQGGETLVLAGAPAERGQWIVTDIATPPTPEERANPGCLRLSWSISLTPGEEVAVSVACQPLGKAP